MSNQLLINTFQKLISEKNKEIRNLKEQKADKKLITPINFKVINFRKALKIIQEHPTEIKQGSDLKDYKGLINNLDKNDGATDFIFRKKMACKTFKQISNYDKIIYKWMNEN